MPNIEEVPRSKVNFPVSTGGSGPRQLQKSRGVGSFPQDDNGVIDDIQEVQKIVDRLVKIDKSGLWVRKR